MQARCVSDWNGMDWIVTDGIGRNGEYGTGELGSGPIWMGEERQVRWGMDSRGETRFGLARIAMAGEEWKVTAVFCGDRKGLAGVDRIG